MTLMGLGKENGWVRSQWNFTYAVSWERICKAVYALYDKYDGFEVLVENKKIEIETQDTCLDIPEAANLTFRGFSRIVKCPIMITMINQTNVCRVNVALSDEEYENIDYAKLNLFLSPFMDSIEINIFRD